MPVTRKPSGFGGPRGAGRSSFVARLSWWQKTLLGTGLLVFLAGAGIFVYFYVKFARVIDARLSGDVFNNASLVFAAPTEVRTGQPGTAEEFAARLRKALYAEGEGGSDVGTYRLSADRLEVYPGPTSFFHGQLMHEGPAALVFRSGRLATIISLDSGSPLEGYRLEPELITTLFDRGRSKRRLVRYQDLPKVLVDAVLATEDHRFFSHHGVNFFRIISAAITDLRAEEPLQGGSTLTMQLARNFFLSRSRTLKRKAAEIFFALLLEQRLTKEQILELYANQVYLGQRGSFSIYGFGEAAGAYFNKDVSSLTLPEAAFLAGLIRGPNLYLPYKHPQRALERRNFVMRRMVETGFVSNEQAEAAMKTPLGLAQQNVEASQAPFFVDMVREQLLNQFSERELLSQSYRIYTTLDLDLQRGASEGTRLGITEVDQVVKKQRRPKKQPPAAPNQPQFALVALDPHTGAIKALIGGRDYGVSQLNHALARRQPGSSFKPFAYAAALNSGVDGSDPLVTPATILQDEPTSFEFGEDVYEPENYKQEYHGPVTLRQALMLSLNVATVRLAEMIGYGKVRSLAVDAGINKDIGSTPALALGAYVATPLEIAGAYTIFANGGQYVEPRCILAVDDASGATLWSSPLNTRRVLDPRVSYLMVSLLQSVVNNGTAYPVRQRGFKLPVAGKTGTSHDGWFAGFTSNLLAVVWVGYDDDRELNLAGASSALPLWTEFMKRATDVPAYSNPQTFSAPAGVVTARIDERTNLVASADSTMTYEEVFIQGTEPTVAGQGVAGLPANLAQPAGASGILNRIFHLKNQGPPAAVTDAPPLPPGSPQPGAATPAAVPDDAAAKDQEKQKEGGVLRKFLSIFKGKSPPPQTQPPPPKKL